ncbi:MULTISPECIES: cytochrome o ubiquinol oxidase subunit IV [unclassified Chelatococcus]|uniref:cytochrome o ubiquinol oxidase subunit IV n=1 Tax=unclassified Chelatococcus TaxID=2638111 RepID=UPI001BCC8BFA|nr:MULTISPECIES: cytochrome o ubiquinol oxidase subunit IV [unclassified Chelatococcus]CAH1648691.1 cytochrome bo3 ubiquinol oxidase subunit 4 [Hyphomicrobiales bacterium]MBS7741885.1 cytochrome o ubiquinol oxidase subunit IV [Chelatococcus sp. HY11]MBX3541317.1 cytochrome o ubiquinol oxidase subunit IV [Chelatococcus sp.]MCO5074790.1 cytochrome o ubiquinol oxidase subunit IV [Chelatococcus sp.]CAH1691311.1 cytochrome bo3 ubiquinol oxidase subunit 4 [Hyphomicrobiales bacterium]
MSTDSRAAHAPTHDHGYAEHETGPSHGTLRSYLTGFVLSVILTAVPFWLVMARPIASNEITAVAIMAFAIVQIVVHMIYFLHMDFHSEGGWTMMALVFTLIIVFIALSGSLWVMYHLDTNMMPGHTTGQTP